MRLILFSICFLMGAIQLTAQVPAPQQNQALVELKKRGLDEQEFRKRLSERGIDIDKVDITNPVEVAKARQVSEAVIAEMEAEKIEPSPTEPTSKPSVSTIKTDPDSNTDVNNELNTEEAPIEDITIQTSQEIQEAVKDGASVEEAIVEEITEQAQGDLGKSKIYGQHIFRNQSIKVYRNSNDFVPPPGYILGMGDVINVSIWGGSQADFSFDINEGGFIQPSGLSRISLKGLTLEQARKKVRSRLSQYYRFLPEEYEMTVSTARTITVNFFGETVSYGSFTLPAINTAFNALVAAGGPSDIGSVRRIRLVRGNKTKEIDVYKFMTDPSIQYDFFLENNDLIYVPIAEKLVSIKGAVKRPYTYELKGEEKLSDLIEFAGGLTVDAYKKNIQIIRLVGDIETIIDLNLQELIASNTDFELKNGDKIEIKKITKAFENFVSISGAVEFPGQYSFIKGMKISDLLEKGILKDETRLDYAFLQRENEDGTSEYKRVNLSSIINSQTAAENIELKEKDKLTVYDQSRYVDNATVSISGAVRNPGDFPFDFGKSLRIEDLVLISGGLKLNAADFAYIERVDSTNNEVTEFIRINIKKAINDPSGYDNILLRPFDKIKIYSNETFTDVATVSVSGAVRESKEFVYDGKMKVSDAIYLANGLRADASDFGYIERIDLNNSKKKEYIRVDIQKILDNPTSSENLIFAPFDKFNIYSVLSFTDVFSISITGAVRSPGDYQYSPSLTIKDVLTFSGGFKREAAKNRLEVSRVLIKENEPTETVVASFGVDNDFNIISGDVNFQLFPYDKIFVREVPDFELQRYVTLKGEVNYPGEYPLLGNNEKLSSIIKRAGGLTEEAFPEGAILIRSEDNVGNLIMKLKKALRKKSSQFNYILKEGDVIEVPKAQDVVSIDGATNVHELYQDKFLQGQKINVAYHSGRRASYYVRKFAGGIDRENRGRKRLITVEHPNGEIKKTLNLGIVRISPKVRPGSDIKVGAAPQPPEKEIKEEKEPVNWQELAATTIAQATSILTLILLLNRL